MSRKPMHSRGLTRHAARASLAALFFLLLCTRAHAQLPGAADMPGVDLLPAIQELPDPFQMASGRRVASVKDWSRRREEIKAMLLYYQYGHLAPPAPVTAHETSSRKLQVAGALERQLLMGIGADQKVTFRLILTIPDGKGPFPAIVKGDLCWERISEAMVEAAVKRGYAVAEFDRTEIAPDSADRTKGVHALYPDYDWSTLGAWAWGFHRTVDYLIKQDFVDPKRIAVTGHSRGGKAALLAGALDERIALTAPNDSGCGGAGCYRVLGPKSEDIGAITSRFPFWFHPRFKDFVGQVEKMPFDQHFLRALVAPRALLSTEALGDLWANPIGTQVSYTAARQVFEYLGAGERTGIFFREGKHEQNTEDWGALLDFADLQLCGRKVDRRFDKLAFPDAPHPYSWSAPAVR
jgi:fermentation-respiration switch protein FrsA (DUF1100 family)